MKLRRDDQVRMTVGRDRGKTGKVLRVMPATSQVVVEGLGIVKRATKPGGKNPRGGILEVTRPLNASKVALICPSCKKPTRIGYKLTGDRRDRVCRKCQAVLK